MRKVVIVGAMAALLCAAIAYLWGSAATGPRQRPDLEAAVPASRAGSEGGLAAGTNRSMPELRRGSGRTAGPSGSIGSADWGPNETDAPRSPSELIAAALGALRADPGDAGEILREFFEELDEEEVSDASSAIIAFLESGDDAATNLPFAVGDEGHLLSAPTLRVALLDQLAEIDIASAAEHARVVLADHASPDEWAIALRNLAWLDPTSLTDPYLRERTAALVTHHAWWVEPTDGFLEAFDLVVHLRAVELLPELERLLGSDHSPELRWAAFLAADRLAIREPERVMEALLDDSGSFSSQPLARASLFARADVRSPEQRRALDDYLLRGDVGPEEMERFASLFPLFSRALSDRLVTHDRIVDEPDQIRILAASQEAVAEWLDDPHIAHRSALEVSEKRLAALVASAARHPGEWGYH